MSPSRKDLLAWPRPWPIPDSPWIMAQAWLDLLFAHWPVPLDSLRPFLPEGLDLDTYEGQAWLGVVPFRMADIRLRGLPPLLGLSAFTELNVRTYVVKDGKPGVWFLSLEAAHPLAVRVARSSFHLPYFDAEMTCEAEGEGIRYRSERTHRYATPAHFQGTYGPVGPSLEAAPGSLESWLTARYCLYSADDRGHLFRSEIHHAPWSLHRGWADIRVNTVAHASGIELPDVPPLLHFSRSLEVRLWAPKRLA